MMHLAEGERRVGYAIERLLAPDEAWRGLVREMVALWSDEPPLEIGFSIVSAAAAIEASFAPGGPSHDAAATGYRLAALISVDVYAMQILEMPRARAADLLAYWEIDPFFARL
ncbi:MAG: hypothetical protein IE922_03945 [Sphingomonadales bacterium]|nr:hypothetical protein [Sphingomonadales bacterium]